MESIANKYVYGFKEAVQKILNERFLINNETRSTLRELYTVINKLIELNNIANKQAKANNIVKAIAAAKAFEDEYNEKVDKLLISNILDNSGTDALHEQVAREIRLFIANNPEVASELEKLKNEDIILLSKSYEDIDKAKNLSDKAKRLLKLELSLKYIRYIGAIRSYLGYDAKNKISYLSATGIYRNKINKYLQDNDQDNLLNLLKNNENVTVSLAEALNTLTQLGKNMFPLNKEVSLD